MLVVADERAGGIGRERGLAGAGEAEEQGHVAVRPDVGAAVHGHHAGLGQRPVHHGEDALLDLAGVFRAADRDGAGGQAQGDGRGAADAVGLGVRLEAGGVQDGPVRLETRELGAFRAEEHVAGEQGVPSLGGDQADAEAVGGIGAGVEVLGVEVLPLQVGEHPPPQRREPLGSEALIDPAPRDLAGDLGVIDHELVLRGAPGVHAGLDDERAVLGEAALAAADGVLDELARGEVGIDGASGPNAGAGKGGGVVGNEAHGRTSPKLALRWRGRRSIAALVAGPHVEGLFPGKRRVVQRIFSALAGLCRARAAAPAAQARKTRSRSSPRRLRHPHQLRPHRAGRRHRRGPGDAQDLLPRGEVEPVHVRRDHSPCL